MTGFDTACHSVYIFGALLQCKTKPFGTRALNKREYLVIIRDNFCKLCIKNICCDPSSEPSHLTPHMNRLDATVQMRGHNIWFR